MAIIEHAINSIPGLGLVIIDGIRDFVYDINCPKEATEIIAKLMQWTDDRQIHIHTILHQNKNDEHARGHIGTELSNKAETVMQVEVAGYDSAVSIVEAIHTRDKEFEPFAFRINDDALPELVEGFAAGMRRNGRQPKEKFNPYTDITEQQHRTALEAAFAQCLTVCFEVKFRHITPILTIIILVFCAKNKNYLLPLHRKTDILYGYTRTS